MKTDPETLTEMIALTERIQSLLPASPEVSALVLASIIESDPELSELFDAARLLARRLDTAPKAEA